MTTYTGLLQQVTPGHAAGYPAKALGGGSATGGVVAFQTGGDTNPGTLVEVTFAVDDDTSIDADSYTIGWLTGTGLGGTPSGTLTVTATATGFTVSSTVAPTADTFYAFNFA
jgi:hypothetical protein